MSLKSILHSKPAALVGTALGGSVGALLGSAYDRLKSQQNQADGSAAQAAAEAAAAQARIDNALATLRASYGVGPADTRVQDATDGGNFRTYDPTAPGSGSPHEQSAEQYQQQQGLRKIADQAQTQIDSRLQRLANDVRDADTLSLNDAFAAALRRNRARFAVRGLIGGSADHSAHNTVVGDYVTHLVASDQRASNAVSQQHNTIDSQRRSDEAALLGNATSSLNLTQPLSDSLAKNANARAQVVPDLISNIFSKASRVS